MQQPISLAELARKVINQRVASMPRLRDLTLPSSVIRYLEETYMVDHLKLVQFKNPDDYVLREMWKCQDQYKANEIQMAILHSYTGEDAPSGFKTAISEWYTFTYKDRLYKMCIDCGENYYKEMWKNKIIRYGNKIILNKHDLLAYAKNPDNWCHLCLTTSLFRMDQQIHENCINQQVEHVFELICTICYKPETNLWHRLKCEYEFYPYEYCHNDDYYTWLPWIHPENE